MLDRLFTIVITIQSPYLINHSRGRNKKKDLNKLHLTTKFPFLAAPPVAAANPPPRFVPDDDEGGGSVINACKLRSFHAGSRVFCCAR